MNVHMLTDMYFASYLALLYQMFIASLSISLDTELLMQCSSPFEIDIAFKRRKRNRFAHVYAV